MIFSRFLHHTSPFLLTSTLLATVSISSLITSTSALAAAGNSASLDALEKQMARIQAQ